MDTLEKSLNQEQLNKLTLPSRIDITLLESGEDGAILKMLKNLKLENRVSDFSDFLFKKYGMIFHPEENKKFWTRTKAFTNEFTKQDFVFVSKPSGYKIGLQTNCEDTFCRPMFEFDDLTDFPINNKYYNIPNSNYSYFTFGEYPQTFASDEIQKQLEIEYDNLLNNKKTKLIKTNRHFTINNNKYGDFIPLKIPEFEYENQKYIHLEYGQDSKWVKVEPVKYIFNKNKKSDNKFKACAETAMYSGIYFDKSYGNFKGSFLNLFNQLHYLVECTNNQLAPESFVINKELKEIPNNIFNVVKGIKNLTIPNTIEKIEKDAFKNCNIKIINYLNVDNNKTYSFHLDNNEKIEQISKVKNGLIFVTRNNNFNSQLYYLDNFGIVKQMENVNLNKYTTLNANDMLDKLFIWNDIKSKLYSNKKILPKEEVIYAIDDSEEMIEKYYESKGQGLDLLEKEDWYQNLSLESKVDIIKMFFHLGGFEQNANYQKQVLGFLNKFIKYYNKFDLEFILDKYCYGLASNLKHLEYKNTVYKRDKNNQLILKDGIAEIKSEKMKLCYQQLLNFCENNYKNKNFLSMYQVLFNNYPDIIKFYKAKLESNNPKRHKEANVNNYLQLIKNGIDFDTLIEYAKVEQYKVKNIELVPVLGGLPKSSFAKNNGVMQKYDMYLSEAKKLTQQVMKTKDKSLKNLSANVVDKVTKGFTYEWPPITSAVALTIGEKFDSCFRVDNLNEVGLVNVITEPNDALMLIYDENNQPCAYCRVFYDIENKGLLIDFIQLDSLKVFSDVDKQEIWKACYRGIIDMKNAMNKEGKHIVERINMKGDPFNVLFFDLKNSKAFPTNLACGAKLLKERTYFSNNLKYKLLHKEYYANCFSPSQLIIDAPELEKYYSKKE